MKEFCILRAALLSKRKRFSEVILLILFYCVSGWALFLADSHTGSAPTCSSSDRGACGRLHVLDIALPLRCCCSSKDSLSCQPGVLKLCNIWILSHFYTVTHTREIIYFITSFTNTFPSCEEAVCTFSCESHEWVTVTAL